MKSMTTLACALLGVAVMGLRAQDVRVPRGDAAKNVMQVYDVRDLVAVMRGPGGRVPTDADRDAVGDVLLKLLAQFGPKIEVVKTKGYLVARTSPTNHKWLLDFLSRQREGLTTARAISFSLVSGTSADIKALGCDQAPRVFESQKALAAFNRKAIEACDVLTVPTLGALPLQLCEARMINQMAYIKRYDVKHVVSPKVMSIADPVVDVVEDGLMLNMRFADLAKDKFGIWFEVTNSEIERPIPTRKTKIAGQELEYSVPVVKTARAESTLTLTRGKGVAVPLPECDGQQMVVVISVE